MSPPFPRMAVRLTLAVTLLAGALLLTRSAASSGGPSSPSPAPLPAVTVASVEPTSISRSAQLSGVTRARRRGRLAFEVGGRLVERAVEAGGRFHRGQVLARLETAQIDNTIAAAAASVAEVDARLQQQERERDRTARLYEAGAATREEMEQAGASVVALRALRDASAARLREASRASAEAVLRAPFDGTVVAVGLQPGEFAAPGAPVLEVAGDGPVEVEFEVPETFIDSLRPGDAVPVTLSFARRDVRGTVATRGAAAGGPGRLFPVIVAVDAEAEVLPGMTAQITVVAGGRRALSVPLGAVLNPGGSRPAVFRLEGDRARRVEIELHGITGDRVAVSGALEAGDRVIVSGAGALADGDRVEVRS